MTELIELPTHLLTVVGFLYLFVGTFATIVIVTSLGIDIRPHLGPGAERKSWRVMYKTNARENLRIAWFWPLDLVRGFVTFIFGAFFRGLVNIFKAEK